ncbi:DUF1800 domain-containing protein [Vibrio ishigakensis]|uniref:DUF1800 domain-containing protein n=1 Tax=Vibrio ishigakensis TaxID=1481914 RepID=UPI0021C2E6B0|nr:DUF1800 domain-containing protein [Vibrio ishigakensis]
MDASVIASHRFGFGPKPDELNTIAKDPKAWVLRQYRADINIEFKVTEPSSQQVVAKNANFRESTRGLKASDPEKLDQLRDEMTKWMREAYRSYSLDSLQVAIATDNPAKHRLLEFFSNHFSVSANGGAMMRALAPTLEREAIQPHLQGRFEDMLLAVEQHPAMLVYLNNAQSFGPNSRFGKRRKKGLNENLAREILELHTLGVDGGYTQQDVTELARGITGWSIGKTGYVYRDFGHEPGSRTLLGVSYSQKGEAQGKKMLQDLARHPNTARHLCTKLARHYVADEPDPKLVSDLITVWQKSKGNLAEVMQALVENDLAWQAPQKFKTPREFVISTSRSIPNSKITGKRLYFSLNQLGQVPFTAGSPKGFSDEQMDWMSGSSLLARADWAQMYAKQSRADVKLAMNTALNSQMSEHNRLKVLRAESKHQALTLLMMSPEFQRR